MSEFLSTLISQTLGGGLAVGLIAALFWMKRVRIGAGWRCAVWALLCLRLAFPVSFGLPALIRLPVPSGEAVTGSVSSVNPAGGGGAVEPPAGGEAVPDESLPPPSSTAAEGPQGSPVSPGPASEKKAPDLPYVRILFAVWAAGAAGMGLWLLLRHLRFLRYLRRWASPVEDRETLACCSALADELGLKRRPRLLRCPGLRSPVLAGVWRTILLLPQEPMSLKELRFSLLHELSHYRRRDLWLKALTLWVNALHWFNPLMWLMVRWVERDMELACDERVLRSLPPEEYRAYGSALLKLASNNKRT